SCSGRCGETFHRTNACHCDYECILHDECCIDYRDTCTTGSSCNGRCNEEFSRGRECDCDPECDEYNKCCPDYQQFCKKTSKPNKPTSRTFTMTPGRQSTTVLLNTEVPNTDSNIAEQVLELDITSIAVIAEVSTIATSTDEETNTETLIRNNNTQAPSEMNESATSIGFSITDIPVIEEEGTSGDDFAEDILNNQPTYQLYSENSSVTTEPKEASADSETMEPSVLKDSSTIAEESKTNPVTLDTEVTEEISVEESSHGKAETEGSKYVSTDSYTSHLASVESSTISPTSSLKENSHTFVSTAEPFTLTEEPKTSPVELTTTGTKNLYRESYTSYLASIASTEVSSTGSPKESTSAFDITEEPFASHNETKTNPVIMQTEEIQSISTESYASHLTSVQSSTVSLTSSLKESTPQFISIVELSTLSEESKMSPAELATAATKGISGETYTSNLASITTTKTTLTSALEEKNSTLDEFKTSPVALQTDITKGILEEPNTSNFDPAEGSTINPTLALEKTTLLIGNTVTVEPSTSAGKPKTNSAELETGAKKDTYAEVYISHLALVASTKVSPTSDLSENTHQKESSTVHSTSSLKETSSLFDNTVEFSTLTENPETDPATVQAVGTISTFTHSGTKFSTLDKESKVSSVTIEAESKIISTEAHTTQLSVTSSTKISGREKSTLVTGANVELSTLAEVPKTNPVAQETQATTKGKLTPKSSTNKFNPENDLSMNPNGSLEKNTILDKRAKEPSILVEKFNESLSTVEIDNPNDTDLCNKRPVDGITTLQNGTMFVFRGHFFWRLNQYGQAQGYPQRIQDVWGIPSPIDTVFTRCNCEGKTFFFKGTQYWRFSNSVKDNGYPKPIFRGFAGLTGKITAALSVSAYNTRPESVYFFKQEKGGLAQQYTYRQESSKSCQKTNSGLQYSIYIHKKRLTRAARKLKINHVNEVLSSFPTMLTYPWFAGILEREISIRTYWKGFPKVIHSAVSVPNPRKPDGHDYFVVSKADRYYNINITTPSTPVASLSQSTISADWYKCP
uniref:SMB domain-containing protein n=1 Tax=Latimeria chalumnae TaxID=7897 RepID=H3B6C4_LATCH